MTRCLNPAVGRRDYGVDNIRSVVTHNNATGTEFNSTKSYMASIQSLFITGWHSLLPDICEMSGNIQLLKPLIVPIF